MLPQSHFKAFNDIKSKHFSNALRGSSIYIIDCIRQPVAKNWTSSIRKFYMRASFVDLLLEWVS